MARSHSGGCQTVAGHIPLGMHASVDTLRDIKYHYAAVNGALYGMNEPRRGRRVAGSERAEHNTFYPRSIEEIIEYVFGNAGMQVDKHYPCVHGVAHLERALDARSHQRFFIEMDAKAYLCERWIVVRLECIEVVGAHLGRAVASPKVVFEKYSHLLHH